MEEKITCDICGKKYPEDEFFGDREYDYNTGNTVYVCDECQEEYEKFAEKNMEAEDGGGIYKLLGYGVVATIFAVGIWTVYKSVETKVTDAKDAVSETIEGISETAGVETESVEATVKKAKVLPNEWFNDIHGVF